MERGVRAGAARKRSRRWTYLWVGLALAVVITLMVTEQVALLYLLATVSVTALLVVVAWSDLEGKRGREVGAAPFDDAAAIADGRTAATTADKASPAGARRQR